MYIIFRILIRNNNITQTAIENFQEATKNIQNGKIYCVILVT